MQPTKAQLFDAVKEEWPNAIQVDFDLLKDIAFGSIPDYYDQQAKKGVCYILNNPGEGICAGIRTGLEGHKYISIFLNKKKAQKLWDKLTYQSVFAPCEVNGQYTLNDMWSIPYRVLTVDMSKTLYNMIMPKETDVVLWVGVPKSSFHDGSNETHVRICLYRKIA
jgi:hypothetical protein